MFFSLRITPAFHRELSQLSELSGLPRGAVIRLLVRRELRKLTAGERGGDATYHAAEVASLSLLRPA